MLRDAIGVRFSALTDNYTSATYRLGEGHTSHWYRCFGQLPDGTGFGVGKVRSISEYWEDDLFFVGKDGIVVSSAISIDGGAIGRYFPMPEAIVASPSGESIVWLCQGQLWVWRYDHEFAGFSGDRGVHCVHIPGDVAVEDARMNENGVVDVWCASGEHYDFCSDIDALLTPGTWGPLLCLYGFPFDHRFSWDAYLDVCLEAVPEIAGLLICWDAELSRSQNISARLSPRFREVRFASDYRSVEVWEFFGMKCERMVLSADVEEVRDGAFALCPNLCELVIEGDLSRIAHWADNAFEDCPCEEDYLELRRKAQAPAIYY